MHKNTLEKKYPDSSGGVLSAALKMSAQAMLHKGITKKVKEKAKTKFRGNIRTSNSQMNSALLSAANEKEERQKCTVIAEHLFPLVSLLKKNAKQILLRKQREKKIKRSDFHWLFSFLVSVLARFTTARNRSKKGSHSKHTKKGF